MTRSPRDTWHQWCKQCPTPLRKALSPGGLSVKGASVFASNLQNQVVHVLLGVFIARKFGADGKGVYSLITNSTGLLAVALSFSLNNAILYYVKRGELSSREGFRLTLQNALQVALAVMVFLVLCRDQISMAFFDNRRLTPIEIAVIVTYSPVLLMRLYLVSLLLARHDTRRYRTLVTAGAWAILAATVAVVMGLSTGLSVALVALMLAELSFAVWVSIPVIRDVSASAPGRTAPTLRALYSFGLRSHLGVVGNAILARIDLLFIAAAFTPAAVGYYAVATFFYQAVLGIPQALTGLLFGAYCDIGPAAACRLNAKITGRLALLLLAALGCALLVGKPVITLLYGPAFVESVPAMNILLLGAVVLGASTPYTSLFLACGMPGVTSQIAVGTGILKIALTAILVPRYGAEGAASATTICAVVILGLRSYFGAKLRRQMAAREVLAAVHSDS